MWLLPWVHRLSRVASGVYYRLAVAGPPIPRDGPVLLVSNHPNALVDPVLVTPVAPFLVALSLGALVAPGPALVVLPLAGNRRVADANEAVVELTRDIERRAAEAGRLWTKPKQIVKRRNAGASSGP